jgi:copper ion binding protein
MSAATTYQFTVRGMTCGHCTAAVEQELSALPGVTSVRVDLNSGGVVVEATRAVATDELAAAVDEAGYEIGEPPQ